MKILAACATAAILAACASGPSLAAPPGPGAVAPMVVLQSVVGGKVENFDLQAAAKTAPVVLYFFPEAFSAG